MAGARNTLVLQAVGPAATLLSVEGSAARGAAASAGERAAQHLTVRVLAAAVAGRSGRDVFALNEPDVIESLAAAARRAGVRHRDVVLVVGGSGVSFHRFTLPRLDPASTRKAARLKLASLLHFSVDQAVVAIDHEPAGDETESIQSCLAAAMPVEAALSACAALDRAGMRVVRLLPAATCIEVLAGRVAAAGPGSCVVALIGEHGTTLTAIDGAKVLQSHEMPAALNDLTLALMRPILAPNRSIELTAEQARALRDRIGVPSPDAHIDDIDAPAGCILPLLQPVLEQWSRGLAQWISFVSTGQGREAVRSIRLIGPAALLPGLDAALTARMGLPVESVVDWMRLLTGEDRDERAAAAAAPAIGAALVGFDLPNLLPRPVSRMRRIERGVAALGLGGPVASAALIALAVLLFRVAGGLAPVAAGQIAAEAGISARLGELRLLESDANYVRRLRRDLSAFAGATPCWTGVLKEVARLLPPQMILRQLEARGDETGMELVLSARVGDGGGRNGFDEVIRRSLLALQASPFFEQVEIVSALRESAGGPSRPQSADLELRMRLVYPGGDGLPVESEQTESMPPAADPAPASAPAGSDAESVQLRGGAAGGRS